jgi:DNA-binding XRE family transcriptional regulator
MQTCFAYFFENNLFFALFCCILHVESNVIGGFMIFFKEKFKSIRESLDLTQDDVAKYLDIKRQSIQRWEDGLCNPRKPKIYKLAELFRCSAEEFADFEPGEYIEKRMTVSNFKEKHGYSPVPCGLSPEQQDAVDDFRKGLIMVLVMASDIDPAEKDKVMKIIAEYHKQPENKK